MRYACIDTETTSLSGYMVELACVILDDSLNIIFSKRWVLNPLAEIEPGAAAVHGYGITKEIGTITFEEIKAEYLALLETVDKVLVYQRHFEWRILINECSRCGIPQPLDVKDKLVDVLQMARNILKLPRNNLGAVIEHLGIEQDAGELHGALPDAIYTAKIYRKLVTGDYTVGQNLLSAQKSPAKYNQSSQKATQSSDTKSSAKDTKLSADQASAKIEIDDFIAAASRKAAALKLASERVKVNSAKTAELALTFASTIQGLISETEKQRTDILRPLKSVVLKMESSVRSSVLDLLNATLSSVRSKIELQCMKMHEDTIKKLEIENDADELEIASSPEDLASVMAEMALDKYSQPVVIKLGSAHTVKFNPIVRVIDPDAVSRAFCSPDIELISQFVQKNGPLTKIEGCEVTYKPAFRLAKSTKSE